MKKLIWIPILLLMCTAAFAGRFTIARQDGTTDPLENGDIITVDSSVDFGFHTVAFVYFEYYHSGHASAISDAIEVHTFEIYGSQLIGTVEYNSNGYDWAEEIGVVVKTLSGQPPRLFTWYSDNRLPTTATMPYIPTLNMWGLILLLIAVPVCLHFRK